MYVNGIQEATGTATMTFSSNGGNQITIGRMGDSSPDRYFSGAIDEVRIYGT